MSYCNTHGRYDGDGCPACRDVENEIIDSLTRSREDLATAAAHIAHAENNPGDYVCPSCMFQTLKKGASRCPKCHADPGRQYWDEVETEERKARLRALAAEKAAKEEWERTAPARAAAAKAAKDEAYVRKVLAGVAGVLFMLFIGIPAGFWVRDAFLPQVICKDVSAHETRSCLLNTAWSSWIKAAEGPAVDGMQVCVTPGGKSERKVMNGTAFFRFKADEGRLVKAYRAFPANVKCPATLT